MSETISDSSARKLQPAEANPWMILVTVSLGLFMSVIDISILNIALPSIALDLGASMSSLEWTLIAYSLTLTALVPIFGRISDVFGRKRLFVAGVVIFTLGSLFCALSGSIGWLIAARIVQAVGGALISTNTLAIITDSFPEGKRGVAMGIQAILISGGAALGPTFGGFLVSRFNWESIFTINLPIGLGTALLAAKILPPLQKHRTLEPIDLFGSILLVGGLTPVMLVLTKGAAWGWLSPLTLSFAAVGVIALVGFVLWELRIPYPLIDLSLFRNTAFTGGQLAGMFATITMSATMFLIPFYWQSLRGFSAQEAGLFMLPMPLVFMIIAPLAGRWSDLHGARNVATLGLAIATVSMYFMSQLTAATDVWDVIWRMTLLGFGLALFLTPNTDAVMTVVPPHQRGVASGLMSTFRFTGQSLGVALSGAILAAVFSASGVPGAAASLDVLTQATDDPLVHALFQTGFMDAMRIICLIAVPMTGIGIVLSWTRDRGRRNNEPAH